MSKQQSAFRVLAFALGVAPAFFGAYAATAQPVQCEANVAAQAYDPFQRGLLATQQRPPGWNLAINHFADALRRAPGSPTILCNLAMAHESAGNEVPAVVYLRAYAEAVQAGGGRTRGTAEAVSAKIRELEARIENRARVLFGAAVEVLDSLPDAEKTKAAPAIVLHMLAALEKDWALKVTRRYPTGMTRAIVAAALPRRRSSDLLVDPVVGVMFDVAEEVAMIDPLDGDLTAPGDLPPTGTGCAYSLPGALDPDEARAELTRRQIEARLCEQRRVERLRPRWRGICQGTFLMTLGVAEAEVGLRGKGYRTNRRGQKMLADLGRSPEGQHEDRPHQDCRVPTIGNYVPRPTEVLGPNLAELFRGAQQAGDSFSGFLGHLRAPAFLKMAQQEYHPLPVDLLKDPVFVAFDDVYRDLKVRWNDLEARRSGVAEVATALAVLGSKLSMAIAIFRD